MIAILLIVSTITFIFADKVAVIIGYVVFIVIYVFALALYSKCFLKKGEKNDYGSF